MKQNFTKDDFCLKNPTPVALRILVAIAMFFLININLHAQGNITLDRENTPIKDIFSEIEQKSSLVFIYSGKLNNELSKRITIKASSEPLKELMNRIVKNTKLKFKILDKQVVIYKEGAETTKKSNVSINTENQSLPTSPLVIKGTVTDKKGEPIIGASIRIKGTTTGLISNYEGKFEVTLQDMKSATLSFSSMGFVPKEVVVNSSQVINVTMEENLTQIQEVVITGFGSKSKLSYTGSQTTVSREELMSLGTKNVLASIQAFVPGMQLLADNNLGSNPNAKPEINIRGRASFEGAANIPIFIVDGSRVSLDFIYDMDLNDIEKVTVLKDASASALYGAKASAGVVVITTKALYGGKLRFNYSGTVRASTPDLSDYHLLNASQKLEYERLAGLYTTKDGGEAQYKLDELYAKRFQTVRSGVNTDWLSKPLQNAISHNHNLSMDGGDENARYNVGVRYGKDNGVMRGSGRERLSGFFKLSYNKEGLFYISNTFNVSSIKSTESPYGFFSDYVRLNPYDVPYTGSGELIKELSYQMRNPLYEAFVGNFRKGEQFYVMNTTDLQVWIKKDFRLDGSFSFMKGKDDDLKFLSPLSKDELKREDPTMRGSLTEGNYKSVSYSGKLMLSYNKYLTEKLFLTAMGGSNIEGNNQDRTQYVSIGYLSEKLAHPSFAIRYPLSGAPGGGDPIDRSVGFFVNFNTIYDNKYFLDVIYRYEGSSKFGKNARFAPFWSLGGGWNIHNEKFMKGADIQTLKLRGSIGYLGNVSFSPYQAMTTYIYTSDFNYTKGNGAVPITIGNRDLKWERTLSSNVGLDLTVFKNRWDLVFDVYYKNTDNLLLDVTKAPSVGVSTARENIGKIENKGIEFQTRVVPVVTRDWNWSLSLNYSYNKNKIKSISDALRKKNEENKGKIGLQPLPIYEEGESLTALKVVPSAGIDPATGQEIYIKRNGEYTFFYDARDKVTFGDMTPYAYGKLGSYLVYKNISLNLMFDYSLGGLIYNQTLASRVEGSDPRYNADERVFNDRWKASGDIAKYKNIADMSIPQQTSRFVQVNNYFSLQSLSLAYEFNQTFCNTIHVKRMRLESTMNDLFYISSVKRERGLNYPFARSVEVSLRVSF